MMDVLIESTKKFEKDLGELSEREKAIAIQKINDCAELFPTSKTNVYRKLKRLPIDLNGYDSSLYTITISLKLKAILAIDEDPIFGQVIFTLFRIVKHDDLDKAYKGVVESLYQDMHHQEREIVLV